MKIVNSMVPENLSLYLWLELINVPTQNCFLYDFIFTSSGLVVDHIYLVLFHIQTKREHSSHDRFDFYLSSYYVGPLFEFWFAPHVD